MTDIPFPAEVHSRMLSEFQSIFINMGKALGRYYNKEYGMTKHFLNHAESRIIEIIHELNKRTEDNYDVELGSDVSD